MEIRTVSPFLKYFEGIRARSVRVCECIPPDRIDWSYGEGKFSLGDLVRHLGASERHMFAENVAGRPSRYQGCGRELADGYDESLAYLHRMHRESVEILSDLSDDDLEGKCTTPGGTEITVWKWLRAMIEHEVHHRGQIYLCLSMLGVATPPIFGLTEEEVRARSTT